MRVPGVRFRLWGLMVAGVAAGGYAMWLRSERFRALARHHAEAYRPYARALEATREVFGEARGDRGWYKLEEDGPELAGRQVRAFAGFHEALERKYRRAARYPWLSVTPDPPPPDCPHAFPPGRSLRPPRFRVH